VARGQEPLHQVRADEARTAGDQTECHNRPPSWLRSRLMDPILARTTEPLFVRGGPEGGKVVASRRKTATRDALCALYRLSGLPALQEAYLRGSGQASMVILLFHRITDLVPEDGLTVSPARFRSYRSEEHTSELQSLRH